MNTVTIHYRDEVGHDSRRCAAAEIAVTCADLILDNASLLWASIRSGRRRVDVFPETFGELCEAASKAVTKLDGEF